MIEIPVDPCKALMTSILWGVYFWSTDSAHVLIVESVADSPEAARAAVIDRVCEQWVDGPWFWLCTEMEGVHCVKCEQGQEQDEYDRY